jgi:hypothetical protein
VPRGRLRVHRRTRSEPHLLLYRELEEFVQFLGLEAIVVEADERPDPECSWFEARYGVEAWQGITWIPRRDWMRDRRSGHLGRANMADYVRATPEGDPYLDFSSLTRDQAAGAAGGH